MSRSSLAYWIGDGVEEGLRRRVGGGDRADVSAPGVGLPGEGADAAGHVHDPRRRRAAQQRQHRVGDPDDAEHVGLHRRPHGRGVDRGRLLRHAAGHAGVVDQHVEAPGALLDQLRRRPPRSRRRSRRAARRTRRRRPRAASPRRPPGARSSRAPTPTRPAQRAQAGRDLVPDPLVRAGDQRDRLFAHATRSLCRGPAARPTPSGWRGDTCRVSDRCVDGRGDAGAAVLRRGRRGAALRAGRPAARHRAAAAVAGDPAARAAARRDAAGTHQPLRHADRGRVGAAAARAGRPSTRSTPPTAVPAAPPSPRPASPGLVLVTKAGASSELLAKLLDAYAAEPGAVAVDVLLCGLGRAGAAAARRPGRRGAAAPAVRLDGRVRHRGAVHGGAGRGPAGRAPAHRPDRTSGRPTSPRCPDLPLPRWPGRDGTYPDGPGPQVRDNDAAVPADRAGPGHGGPAGLVPRPAASTTSPPCRCWTRPPVTTVIAWPPHSRSRALAGLVRAATRL